MNDTLSVKDLSIATLDAANFTGSVRSFPRVANPKGSPLTESRRQSLHVDSRSPCVLRVAHSGPSGGFEERSLMGVDQTLTRIDALSNPIGSDRVKVSLVVDRTAGVSLAEYKAAVTLLLASLLENTGANIDAIYNREK